MQKITQAVILAGGAGTRLKPFTLTNPKPMIPINGKPFLEYLVNLLKQNGIKEIIILTGYLGEKIEKYFGDGSKFNVRIKYSYTPFLNKEGLENKNGLRLKNAKKLLDNIFLLLYCDNYWPLDLKQLLEFYTQHPSDLLVTVYSNKDNSSKNNISVTDGYVNKYDKGRESKGLNGVEIGFFIVNKDILNSLPNHNPQFETTIFPQLIRQKKLSSFLTDQKYYSIGTLEKVKLAEKYLSAKKIVFLDRDGTINEKPAKGKYVTSWKEFKFLPGALDAIRLLTNKGYKIFIVSNQAGIERGMITRKDLESIHRKMLNEIKKCGGMIEKIYVCPHDWNSNCDCRKPKAGMLVKASNDHFIDLREAIFIGDDKTDQEAGERVGCKTILINTKNTLLSIAHSLS